MAPIGNKRPIVDDEPPSSPYVRRARVFSAIVSVVGVFGCCLTPVSGFMFDAPTQNPATYALAFSTISLPVTCLGAAVTSNWLIREERYSAACWIHLVPFANMIVWAIAAACIQFIYGGSLTK